MTKGIAIISWDEFEGGEVSHCVPEGLEVDEMVVQRVQISHNFTESWIITQEEHFNGLSYFDPRHNNVILLVLDPYDDGQDYHEIVNQVNELLLKEPAEEELLAGLNKIYALMASVYKAREQVLMKLANEIADLKLQHHEIKRNAEIIADYTKDGATRILLFVALNEPAPRKKIAKHVQVTERWLDVLLDRLLSERVLAKKDGNYYIA